mgnify:CR=1 FL=1
MNQKIQKAINDIAKTKTKITELQAKLRDLEAQRIDMENTEIVGLFRSANVAPQDLADFIRKCKVQTTAQPKPAYQAEQEVFQHE